MNKTDPATLVYDATKQPWAMSFASQPGDAYCAIVSPHRSQAICTLEPDGHTLENAKLICAAPMLLKVAQKLLLWMEECMVVCDFNEDGIDLYDELHQAIKAAGGFSSDIPWR
jgi:hypothetical protein